MKLIVLAMVLAMMLLFSACGGDPATRPTVENTAETAEQSVEIETDTQTGAEEIAELDLDDFLVTDLGDGTCEIRSCFVEAKVLEVPETINGMTVVGIGSFGMAQDGIEEVILPDTVTYIASDGFNCCSDLKKIDLGDGLKSIGTSAFFNCPNLERVEFPEGMESISHSIFDITETLTEVYIPASVTEFEGQIALDTLCPNLVVVTPAGSAAEQMAIEAELPVRNP